MSFLLLALGVVLLYIGGEYLVNGATALASRLGLSRLVIGLTVVAFGTSAPELAATLSAVAGGVPELGVGNVLGSNTANVGLILGVAALIYPLSSTAHFVKREVPVMLLVSILLLPAFWDGSLSRLEGLAAVLMLGLYLWRTVATGTVPLEDDAPPPRPLWQSLGSVLLGVALLVAGAQLLIIGAVDIARGLGVPEVVIGLTLVAFGTSVPELASSVVAAVKREPDLILGNVIGSNVFNVLAVLGVTSLLQPFPVSLTETRLDIGVMLGFGTALGLLMLPKRRLNRLSGGLLVIAYLSYAAALYLFA